VVALEVLGEGRILQQHAGPKQIEDVATKIRNAIDLCSAPNEFSRITDSGADVVAELQRTSAIEGIPEEMR
jgi:hypothetical protein